VRCLLLLPNSSYKLKVISIATSDSNKSFFFHNCLEVHDPFFSNSFKTVGVSLKIAKYEESNEETLTMAVWDINSSKRFDFLYPTFFRGAAGCLLFFNASNYDKSDSLEQWINKIREYTNYIPIILIGTCLKNGNDIDLAVLKKYVAEFNVDDVYLLENNDIPQCTTILNSLALKILENIGTKFTIEKLKNHLSAEERELYNKFINRFSTCPICKKSNHLTYLNRFYFSKVPNVVQLRKSLLSLLIKMNDFKYPNEIALGIPCCRCHDKFFTN